MKMNEKRLFLAFLFFLGIALGSAICMKWMEGQFLFEGKIFSILGLELQYPPEKISTLLSGIEEPVKNLLRFHLRFDFVFMAGVYPSISILCLWASARTPNPHYRKILRAFAMLQAMAWFCDIRENLFLFQWIKDPGRITDFSGYHRVVWIKWLLALSGLFVAVPGMFLARKK